MDESGSGRLVVLSGPSGAGKTTACDRLQADPAITRAITATTRAPRAGEVDGVHYFFFDEESFRKGIEEGKFLEHAEVHGRFYGTPKEHLEELIASGRTVLLSIDVQGAEELMDRRVPAIYIFLEPPSLDELKRRLVDRASDDSETIELRLKNALDEMARRDRYDHCIVNDDLDRAVDEILGLIGEGTAS